MAFQSYLERLKEHYIEKLMVGTENLLQLIEDDNKKFLKKYSEKTKTSRLLLGSDVSTLRDINRAIKEIKMVETEDIYKQIIYLDQITLFLATINTENDHSLLAKFILGVPNSKEKFLNNLKDSTAVQVEEKLEELGEVSEEEIKEAKEKFLKAVKEAMDRMNKLWITYSPEPQKGRK